MLTLLVPGVDEVRGGPFGPLTQCEIWECI